jgi:hypothetical protein
LLQEDERQKKIAHDLQVELRGLLGRSKAIEQIDHDSVEAISILAASYRECIEEIKKASSAEVASICSIFPHVRFEGCSEEQLIDLKWAYQYLKLRSAGNKERKPTLYKVLYWIDRVARQGEDKAIASRWEHVDLEELWSQMVGGSRG